MNLSDFFRENNKAAIAFSGGVDSACLLMEAVRSGARVTAYYVKTAFQPRFELEDAKRIAELLHADLRILEADILSHPPVAENPSDRCYYCKKIIFSLIMEAAGQDGYELLLDGTNASDDPGDRPGTRAMRELSVRSPLRECGLTKEEIRSRLKEAGLFVWNKPAYACLATRIPCGTAITAEKLAKTEAAEEALSAMGFTDFRVRMTGDGAKLQVTEAQLEKVIRQREAITDRLKQYYPSVVLDLEVRR